MRLQVEIPADPYQETTAERWPSKTFLVSSDSIQEKQFLEAGSPLIANSLRSRLPGTRGRTDNSDASVA